MRQRIVDLRLGRRSVGVVIDDLHALLWRLPEAPEAWRERFLEAWSVLEIDYASALDRGQPLPTAGERDIAAALDDLDRLVAERLPLDA